MNRDMFTHPFWRKYAPFAGVMGAVGTWMTFMSPGGGDVSTNTNITNIYPAAPAAPEIARAEIAQPQSLVEVPSASASVEPTVEAAAPAEAEYEPVAAKADDRASPAPARSNTYLPQPRQPVRSPQRPRYAQREETLPEPTREPAQLVFRHVAQ